jgi:glycolate oxidase FAD binding subunit
VTVPVASPADASRLTQTVVHSQVVPGALELDLPATGPGSLTVLLAGIAEGVEGRTRATLRLLGAGATALEDAPAGWGEYPWSPTAAGDDRAVALKLTFALSGLVDVLEAARRAPVLLHVRGSSGTGVVYAALPAGTDPGAVAEAVGHLRGACVRHGGSAVVIDAAAGVKAAVDSWGPVPALALMRRVKDQFDPDHRLAPGRFVGGI